jgi:hypothetical protein
MKAVGVELEFEPAGGKTRVRIERVLIGFEGAAVTAQWASRSEECTQLSLQLHLPQHHLHELLAELADISEVTRIEQTSFA